MNNKFQNSDTSRRLHSGEQAINYAMSQLPEYSQGKIRSALLSVFPDLETIGVVRTVEQVRMRMKDIEAFLKKTPQ